MFAKWAGKLIFSVDVRIGRELSLAIGILIGAGKTRSGRQSRCTSGDARLKILPASYFFLRLAFFVAFLAFFAAFFLAMVQTSIKGR